MSAPEDNLIGIEEGTLPADANGVTAAGYLEDDGTIRPYELPQSNEIPGMPNILPRDKNNVPVLGGIAPDGSIVPFRLTDANYQESKYGDSRLYYSDADTPDCKPEYNRHEDSSCLKLVIVESVEEIPPIIEMQSDTLYATVEDDPQYEEHVKTVTVTAGETLIAVDNTDPEKPILSATNKLKQFAEAMEKGAGITAIATDEKSIAGNGKDVAPLSVKISEQAGNAIVKNGDGLYVDASPFTMPTWDSILPAGGVQKEHLSQEVQNILNAPTHDAQVEADNVTITGDGTDGDPLTVQTSSMAGNAIKVVGDGLFAAKSFGAFCLEIMDGILYFIADDGITNPFILEDGILYYVIGA